MKSDTVKRSTADCSLIFDQLFSIMTTSVSTPSDVCVYREAKLNDSITVIKEAMRQCCSVNLSVACCFL